MRPTEISSLFLPPILLFTIYNKNYILLISEIPLTTTTILHHHKLVSNIVTTDILFAHYSFWFHIYFAYYYSNVAIYTYCLCPILFIISNIFYYYRDYDNSQRSHAGIHYMLILGTIFLNLTMNNKNILQNS